MTAKRIEFLGLPLDTGLSIKEILDLLDQKGEMKLVGYISPSSWAVAERHPDYLEAMKQMSVIRAGGAGVSYACNWITGLPCPRISFDMTSMAGPFFERASAKGSTIILAGGDPGVDEQMHEKLKLAYPKLKVVGTLHGYGEIQPKIAMILEKNPDAVVIGMGSPRQELFLVALRDAGYKGYAITCGGFFDQYLLADDYYPKWVDKLHLRFLWRFYKEPARLWRRYMIDYQIFVWKALKALWEKYFPQAEAFAKENIARAQAGISKVKDSVSKKPRS